jgi:hypothetical protein
LALTAKFDGALDSSIVIACLSDRRDLSLARRRALRGWSRRNDCSDSYSKMRFHASLRSYT